MAVQETSSRFEKSWIQVRNNQPVEVFPRKMFQQAWETQSKLDSIQPGEGQKAYREAIEAEEEVADIVREVSRTLNNVYQEAREYEKASKAFYRLIDMNLRFYRYAEIDQLMDGLTNTSGTVIDSELIKLQKNLEKLLNAVKNSIDRANEETSNELDKEEVEAEPEVIYLVSFARQLESSLRYTAKYVSKVGDGDGGGIGDDGSGGGGGIRDYYGVIEQAEASDAMTEMEERLEKNEEFMDEAEETIESAFEDEVDDTGFN